MVLAGQDYLLLFSGFFHVKDTGFDPLIKHMKANKIFAVRSISIEEMPCLTPPATKGIDSRFSQYQILNREFIAIVDGSTFGAKMPRVNVKETTKQAQVILAS